MHIELSCPYLEELAHEAKAIRILYEVRGRRVLVRDFDAPAYADLEFDVVITCRLTER